MKVLHSLEIGSFLVAGAAVLAGEYLELPWLSGAAPVAFGVAVLAGGVRILVTGQSKGAAAGMDHWYRPSKYTERHTGTPARLIGALLLIAGLLFIVMGVIALTARGGMDAFWQEFLKSPRAWGAVAGLAGIMMTLAGTVRAIAGSGAAPGAYNRVVEAEFKIGGVVTAAVGLGLLFLAAVLLMSPDYLPNALDKLF